MCKGRGAGGCILKELKPGGGWGEREGKNLLSLTVFGEQLHGKLLFYYHFEILHRKHTTYCLHLGPTVAPALDLGRLTARARWDEVAESSRLCGRH